MQVVHSGRNKPLEKYLGIPKQEVGHIWEYRDGKATLVFFP